MPVYFNAAQRWLFARVALLLLAAGWIFLSRADAAAVTGGLIPAPQTGFRAPEIQVFDPQGNPVNLSDYRGQPVVINFWASWCPPCQAEMPAFERAHQQLAPQGLVILSVNVTQQDSPSAAQAFVEARGLTLPFVLDLDGSAEKAYQIRSLPTTFWVGADGVITDVVIGGPLSEAQLLSASQKLLTAARP